MATSGPQLTDALGYLLKHAHLLIEERINTALLPWGLDARELGVLVAIAASTPLSQQEVSQRLGVDRTTMVALVDTLETKGVVTRHPDASDRRRNVVELTRHGRAVLTQALDARNTAERDFLAPLGPRANAAALRQTLQTLITYAKGQEQPTTASRSTTRPS